MKALLFVFGLIAATCGVAETVSPLYSLHSNIPGDCQILTNTQAWVESVGLGTNGSVKLSVDTNQVLRITDHGTNVWESSAKETYLWSLAQITNSTGKTLGKNNGYQDFNITNDFSRCLVYDDTNRNSITIEKSIRIGTFDATGYSLRGLANGNLVSSGGEAQPYSHVEGYKTTVRSYYAHAEGSETEAKYAAHSEGKSSKAYGSYSHAEGSGTANGEGAHAEGTGVANGEYSHAEGYATESNGHSSHAEGNATKTYGNGSHSEGYQTVAYGDYSHAEGWMNKVGTNTTTGVGSHAEGYANTVIGNCAHAEGNGNTVNADYAFASGVKSTVKKDDKYAFVWNGDSTTNYVSHGEGTFSVNPKNGLNGFYIGTNTLYSVSKPLAGRTFSLTNQASAVAAMKEVLKILGGM